MSDRQCSIEECGKSVFCRGWCRRHWNEWRATQSGPLYGPRHTGCLIADCDRKHRGRGYCTLHLERLQRTGDPLQVRKRVNVTERCTVDGCDRRGTGGRLMCSLHYQRWKAHGSTSRQRGIGENQYAAVDLLTGRLTIVRLDGTRHVSLYDLADHDLISRYRWHINPGGYVVTTVGGRVAAGRVIVLHRLLLGLNYGDERLGDHINGDRLDNRRANLRVADYKLNAANQAIINESGTSRYRGVCWDKSVGRWKAYTHVDGLIHNIGFYTSEQQAADVVLAYRAAHHLNAGYPRRHEHTPSKSRSR